uniref:Uncharacterized protein n=1 Tax=Peronospora matthiolae TaxID=2874970 RepID=A0AAV1UH00_9STRA
MGFSTLFALSVNLRLLVNASQAPSLDDPHDMLPTAQENASKPGESLAVVHPFVVQDLEDRGFRSEYVLDAINFVLDITRSPEPSTIALREEEGKVERLILSHLPANSDKHPVVTVVHHKGPADFRFTGEAYERACELPVVKTPVFARLYDDLVESIGPNAALRQLQYRPGGPWQVTAIHNEMLQQAQFASWFKAAKDPKPLEEAATIDKVELAGHPTEPEKVAKHYDDFINGMLQLSRSHVDTVESQTSSIFDGFKTGEHEIACESILSERINIRKVLDTYSGATTTLGVEDLGVLSQKKRIEDIMFGIWFIYKIEPFALQRQRLNSYKWLDEYKTFIDRYTRFIKKQQTEVSKLRVQHPRDGDTLNDPKRHRTAY